MRAGTIYHEHRTNNGTTENPGTLTLNTTSTFWNGYTIAVWPAAAAGKAGSGVMGA